MIKKLKIRFVIIATLCAAAVVLILSIGINLFNYQQTSARVFGILDAVSEMEEHAPSQGEKPDGADGIVPFGRGGFSPVVRSPEANSFMRLFTATADENNNIVSVDVSRMTAMSEEDAATLAAAILGKGAERGRDGIYFYQIDSTDGGTRLSIIDGSQEIQVCINILSITALVSLGAVVISFLIALLFSGRAVVPVAENYERQKRFITDAGHELKTPVSIIQANVEALEMTDGANKWTENIRQQSGRLISLVRDMVALARMDERADRRILPQSEVALGNIAREAAEAFSELAASTGKGITTDIADDIKVAGDAAELQKLISVLLDNAVRHSSDGAEIKLKLISDGRKAQLEVSNPSAVIDKRKMKHIFDRFYRVDESRSRDTGGFGIGLSLAKSIADAHGGDIAASCRDGQFTVRFTVKCI